MARKRFLVLIGAVLLLLVLGLVMQGSISPFLQDAPKRGQYAALNRQIIFVVLGALLGLGASLLNFRHWQRIAWPLYGLTVILLILCFVPVVRVELNGAKRWINLIFIQFQPSELAKLIGVIITAWWCTEYASLQQTAKHGFLYPIGIIAVMALLIAAEVDLGNTALLLVATLCVLFVAGTQKRYIALCAVGAPLIIAAAAWQMPERMGRIIAFLDLEKYRNGDGLQQWLSLRAFGVGGDTGVGIGQSVEKRLGGIPYPNSDFIFPIIGEELGLWVCLATLACYLAICISGTLIALSAPDRFSKLLAFGIVSLITAQSLLHVGVCLAVLPNKGMSLPFVSAGGSNLMLLCLAVGILVNIYRQAKHPEPEVDALLWKCKPTSIS
jgi:cell division protein FtsW